MIYYVSGNFGSRRGVEVGSITLHPSGLPHGPQPGLAEKALGIHETSELAVMCDTFNPLKLSRFAQELDDGVYWRSWYENAQAASRRGGRRDRRRAHVAPLDADRLRCPCGRRPRVVRRGRGRRASTVSATCSRSRR